MPVLESNDHITPRSALRHRSLTGDGERRGKHATSTSSITPVAQRASLLHQRHTENRQSASTGGVDNPQRGRFALRARPLLFLSAGMITMLVLSTVLSLAVNWWGTTWDDIHYGRPRTFQIDMVVGHNDSAASPSHFIALNLHGRIEVIEFPGGDASRARIYIGPQLYGKGADLIPVTLRFIDARGDHLPSMIIAFQDTRIVYSNDHGGFRPATPAELQAVEQYLKQHGQ